MKKLCFLLLLMFLIVTSVYGQEENIYEQILNGSVSNDRTYSYYWDDNGNYTYAPEWLTKRWADAYGNCLIKGNISYKSGDKIYHIPGWKDYNATKINTDYGERWFCTEWEAYQAGWRAPKYANRPKTYPNPYGN